MNLPREDPFRLILGSEFHFDGFRLVALARNVTGWGNLCEFITAARLHAKKGEYIVSREHSDFTLLDECEILIAPAREGQDAVDAGDVMTLQATVAWAKNLFGERTWLAVELTAGPGRCAVAGHAAARRAPPPACRWWPPAMCTCTCARARPCRM